jgi:hypothetical protein
MSPQDSPAHPVILILADSRSALGTHTAADLSAVSKLGGLCLTKRLNVSVGELFTSDGRQRAVEAS